MQRVDAMRAVTTAGVWLLVVLLVVFNPLMLLGLLASWAGLAPDVRTGHWRK